MTFINCYNHLIIDHFISRFVQTNCHQQTTIYLHCTCNMELAASCSYQLRHTIYLNLG